MLALEPRGRPRAHTLKVQKRLFAVENTRGKLRPSSSESTAVGVERMT
jgi:hypothetical protein